MFIFSEGLSSSTALSSISIVWQCSIVFTLTLHIHYTIIDVSARWQFRFHNLTTLYIYICDLQSLWGADPTELFSKMEFQCVIESALFRSERENWLQEVYQKEKLRTYVMFKTEYDQEIYLSRINVHAHRSLFAKLRGGTAPLAIELGRYRRPIIPRENRLCPLCERAVEDEPAGEVGLRVLPFS